MSGRSAKPPLLNAFLRKMHQTLAFASLKCRHPQKCRVGMELKVISPTLFPFTTASEDELSLRAGHSAQTQEL